MTDDIRVTLWRTMRGHGLLTPEGFAARYGRRLCDLTPAKALEILTTPAVRSTPPIAAAAPLPPPVTPNERTDTP